MRREVIKAFVGFFLLGVILGGMYLLLRHIIGEERDTTDEARHTYWLTRFDSASSDLPAPEEEEVVEEETAAAPAVCQELTVRGRVLDAELAAEAGQEIFVESGDGDRVQLEEREGWLVSPGLQTVAEISLVRLRRPVSFGPFPVGESEGRVRFNWVDVGDRAGLLSFKDIACVESGTELRVFFEGRADLPDGGVLFAQLSRGERLWCSGEVPVSGKAFSGLLVPLEKGYPSGRYRLSLAFDPVVQDPDDPAEQPEAVEAEPEDEGFSVEEEPVREEPENESSTGEDEEEASVEPQDASSGDDAPAGDGPEEEVPTKWSGYVFTEIGIDVYVGDPEQEREEQTEELSEYVAIVKKGKALRRSYEVLRDLGLSAKGPSVTLLRKAERYFPRGVPQVSENGELNVPEWRHWIDTMVTPRIATFQAEISGREVPVEVRAYMLVEAYAKGLLKFVRLGSQLVYRSAGLEPDMRDFCAVSLSLEDEEMEVAGKLLALERALAAELNRIARERQKEPEGIR